MIKDYDAKILLMLKEVDQPVDIEKIRVATGIGNWNTALSHCLALLLKKQINGVKTSKSWVFWKKVKMEDTLISISNNASFADFLSQSRSNLTKFDTFSLLNERIDVLKCKSGKDSH